MAQDEGDTQADQDKKPAPKDNEWLRVETLRKDDSPQERENKKGG